MRIGIDIRPLLEPRLTGVGEYTREVVRHLLKQAPQHEFRLFASGARKRALPEIGLSQHPRAVVKWLNRPNKIVNLSLLAFEQPALDRILGGVDVFFSPNLHFTALQPHCPQVLTVHDVSFALFPHFFSTRRRLWHSVVGANQQSQHATHLICDSRSTADDLEQTYGVARERISVVPLGVADEFHPIADRVAQTRVKQKYNLATPYLLALGTIEPRKNLTTLIEAFDQLRAHSAQPLQLVIAGPAGWKTGAFWRATRRSPFAKDIRVLGFVEPAERPVLISMARAVAAVSSYEGFGLPALEAMRCAVPVVTSAVSSLPEVVEQAAVLVDPERPAVVAQGLKVVCFDENARARLIRSGLEQSAQFSWQRTAEQTLRVLESVVNNQGWYVPASFATEVI